MGSIALPSDHARFGSATGAGQDPAARSVAAAAWHRPSLGTSPAQSVLLQKWRCSRASVHPCSSKSRTACHLGQCHSRWIRVSSASLQCGHNFPPGTHLAATLWVTVPPVIRTRRAAFLTSGLWGDHRYAIVAVLSMPSPMAWKSGLRLLRRWNWWARRAARRKSCNDRLGPSQRVKSPTRDRKRVSPASAVTPALRRATLAQARGPVFPLVAVQSHWASPSGRKARWMASAWNTLGRTTETASGSAR